MNSAVFFEGFAHVLDVETDEVPELDVGDLALGLHLAEPAQGGPTVFIEEDFEEAFGAD